MFFEYLHQFDLSVFDSIYVIVKAENYDIESFNNKKTLFNFMTTNCDYLYDAPFLFNNLDVSSMAHKIVDYGKSLVLMVLVHE